MKKYLAVFFLLQTIRAENQRGINPNLDFLISKLKERFTDSDSGFAKRTVARHLQTIKNELNIEVYFENGGYVINEDDFEKSKIEATLEAFEIYSALNLQIGMPDFVIAENRKSSGIKYFHFLAKSIIAKNHVRFLYKKFDGNEKQWYEITPYALKESRHRWYVIGVKKGENELKSFGLDRILDLAQSDGKFKTIFSLQQIKNHFANSFAMFTDGEVENVVLKYDKRDGNYIRTFPIHHSQQIIAEDEKSVTLSVKVRITLDFMMELMSRAWSLEVLEPVSLREKMAKYFEEAARRNG